MKKFDTEYISDKKVNLEEIKEIIKNIEAYMKVRG